MIGWVDVETTGLSAADAMLEVAVVLTDDELVGIGAVSALHRPEGWDWLERISAQPAVLAMHSRSRLIDDLLATRHQPLYITDFAIARFLDEHRAPFPSLVLAGASVSFDRGVLQRWLPRTAEWFHYRQIDVSTLKELARRWAPELAREVPSEERPHRALEDVRESIDLLRHYRASGFVGVCS